MFEKKTITDITKIKTRTNDKKKYSLWLLDKRGGTDALPSTLRIYFIQCKAAPCTLNIHFTAALYILYSVYIHIIYIVQLHTV